MRSEEPHTDKLDGMIPPGSAGLVPRLIGLLLDERQYCLARAFMRAPRHVAFVSSKHDHVLHVWTFCDEDAELLSSYNAEEALRLVHADSRWDLAVHSSDSVGEFDTHGLLALRASRAIAGSIYYQYAASNDFHAEELAVPMRNPLSQKNSREARMARETVEREFGRYAKVTAQPRLDILSARIAQGQCRCLNHTSTTDNKADLSVVVFASRRPPGTPDDSPDWHMSRDSRIFTDRVRDVRFVEIAMSNGRSAGKAIALDLSKRSNPRPDVVLIVRGGSVPDQWFVDFVSSELQRAIDDLAGAGTRFYVGIGHSGRGIGGRLRHVIEGAVPQDAARRALYEEVEYPALVVRAAAELMVNIEGMLATHPSRKLATSLASAIEQWDSKVAGSGAA